MNDDLHTSPNGRAETMLAEGVVLHTYLDPTGTPTCLCGHTAAAGPPIPSMGQIYTRADADRVLSSDLARIYEPAVRRLVKRDMTQGQFDAFTDFAFNAGAGNLASSSMVSHFNAGDVQGAADAFLGWTKSKGVVLPGLEKRRVTERAMFLNGTYPGIETALDQTTRAMNGEHMIARGAKGDDVVALQKQLSAAGYPVKPDGSFGAATDNAVREFQSVRGLPVDGVVGLKTWMALDKVTDDKPVLVASQNSVEAAARAAPFHVDTDKPQLALIEGALNRAASEKVAVKPSPVAASASVPTAPPAHADVAKAASPTRPWWKFWGAA